MGNLFQKSWSQTRSSERCHLTDSVWPVPRKLADLIFCSKFGAVNIVIRRPSSFDVVSQLILRNYQTRKWCSFIENQGLPKISTSKIELTRCHDKRRSFSTRLANPFSPTGKVNDIGNLCRQNWTNWKGKNRETPWCTLFLFEFDVNVNNAHLFNVLCWQNHANDIGKRSRKMKQLLLFADILAKNFFFNIIFVTCKCQKSKNVDKMTVSK